MRQRAEKISQRRWQLIWVWKCEQTWTDREEGEGRGSESEQMHQYVQSHWEIREGGKPEAWTDVGSSQVSLFHPRWRTSPWVSSCSVLHPSSLRDCLPLQGQVLASPDRSPDLWILVFSPFCFLVPSAHTAVWWLPMSFCRKQPQNHSSGSSRSEANLVQSVFSLFGLVFLLVWNPTGLGTWLFLSPDIQWDLH